jgi:hypothetical protein
MAIREYLEGTLRAHGKRQVEEHLKNCPICSEAVEGFKRHKRKGYIRSDVEFLTNKVRSRYASHRVGSRKLPVMIVFSIFMSLIILLIIFYIIRQFLSDI